MFKGYISNTNKHFRWIVHKQKAFLLPYLKQIENPGSSPYLNILRKHRYKTLAHLEVPEGNGKQIYIVKIYTYPRIFQKLKRYIKSTKAFHEFHMTYFASQKGIPVEVPVAYGERKHFFHNESFLIIRKIKQCCSLREFFDQKPSGKEKRYILKKFGKLARIIHDAGAKQDDFSLDNFLVCNDGDGGKRVILIDFERVTMQAASLNEKQRILYLAKINRSKGQFTNTERLRVLVSYTHGDLNSAKKLAQQIELTTIRLHKKDARKYQKQCIRENRKFAVYESHTYYGHYRKNYACEQLKILLRTAEESQKKTIRVDHFHVTMFKNNGTQYFSPRIITQEWIHANALFALRINVPVPVACFKNRNSKSQITGFLISHIPENSISLTQFQDIQRNDGIMHAMIKLAEQISPFGIFEKDLKADDILVQEKEKGYFKCYLGNYALLKRNHHAKQTAKTINVHTVRQLLHDFIQEKTTP